MVYMCVRKDSSHCYHSHITLNLQILVMWLGSQWEESILMHLLTIWFSFYTMVLLNLCIYIKYWWKVNFIFLYYVLQSDFNFLYYVLECELICVPTSGSGFCQWVWILSVGLDFASGSGYEDPMGQTPCCIMWSKHNHGIKVVWCILVWVL